MISGHLKTPVVPQHQLARSINYHERTDLKIKGQLLVPQFEICAHNSLDVILVHMYANTPITCKCARAVISRVVYLRSNRRHHYTADGPPVALAITLEETLDL